MNQVFSPDFCYVKVQQSVLRCGAHSHLSLSYRSHHQAPPGQQLQISFKLTGN